MGRATLRAMTGRANEVEAIAEAVRRVFRIILE